MSRADDLATVDAALTRIGRAANSRRAAQTRAARAGLDLPAGAMNVLAAIYRGGPGRMVDVAARIDMEPSRVSKDVRRLHVAGYVEPRHDAADRRVAVLHITARGKRAFERYRRAADELLAELLEPWSDAQVRTAANVLQRLSDLVGEQTP